MHQAPVAFGRRLMISSACLIGMDGILAVWGQYAWLHFSCKLPYVLPRYKQKLKPQAIAYWEGGFRIKFRYFTLDIYVSEDLPR
jgi:hypothetical protein